MVHDPRVTEFPLHSCVLFSPPVGRSDKLIPQHRGPYQVMHISGAIYTIQDLGESDSHAYTQPPSFQLRWRTHRSSGGCVAECSRIRCWSGPSASWWSCETVDFRISNPLVRLRRRTWCMPSLFIGIFMRIRCGLLSLKNTSNYGVFKNAQEFMYFRIRTFHHFWSFPVS